MESRFSFRRIAEIDANPLFKESDRGCVLICAADLENRLHDLLYKFFSTASLPTKSQYADLFDFRGPLGTFSSLIKISRAIGLLDESLYSDLELMRKIRNNAAHSNGNFNLSDADNSSIIKTMHYDWSKLKQIKRYALKNKKRGKSEKVTENENVMKGFGFIRHDKVNFIMTSKIISLELTKLQMVAAVIGADIAIKRRAILSSIKSNISEKDTQTD